VSVDRSTPTSPTKDNAREDGTFSHKVDLAEGENTIVVRRRTSHNVAEVTRS